MGKEIFNNLLNKHLLSGAHMLDGESQLNKRQGEKLSYKSLLQFLKETPWRATQGSQGRMHQERDIVWGTCLS